MLPTDGRPISPVVLGSEYQGKDDDEEEKEDEKEDTALRTFPGSRVSNIRADVTQVHTQRFLPVIELLDRKRSLDAGVSSSLPLTSIFASQDSCCLEVVVVFAFVLITHSG
jgi:hypothetical protein